MRTKHLAAILVLLALAVPASRAQAGGVVSVCDEAHLLAALAGGGTVTFTCSGTITAQVTIVADTTIDGSGQDVTIFYYGTVFYVNRGIRLHLNELTVTNGITLQSDGGGIYNDQGMVTVSNSRFNDNDVSMYGRSNGGAIYNNLGTLTVSNSTFSNNSASGGGGGIFNNYGTLTVSNSTFSGNSALDGGGIDNHGTLTVSDSTFSDNSGAGIYNYAGPLFVINSTFSGNSARDGGGIDNHGTLTVSDSTFSGNSATFGGGIFNMGTLTVSNSTFAQNSAYVGGGIYNHGTLTMTNSTFSGNSASSVGGNISTQDNHIAILKNTIVANSLTGGNCAGTITDGGGNLSYPDNTCPGINADPLLGPLQDNGGPTWTMALLPGSAAIDTGDDAICAAEPVNNLDQRGVTRPQGPHCDIGAVERQVSWLWFPFARAQ